MIVTNLLTQINFSGLTGTLPTAWDLSPTYPNGALDVTHIQARSLVGTWSAWGAVTAFDNTTNIATFTAAVGATQVEFRRQTPRYSAYLDPKAPTSRVSQRNLQVNADQGLYVASELAADLGLDAQAATLPDPTTTPNVLGLVHQTQNRWGTADYTKKSWNFQFAGGYIDRSHVKAQVLLSTGWTALSIDQVNPAAPFRFIGDYTLFLDFSTLTEVPTGLIIYRHTPRNVHVSSPLDHARITAAGVDPSARHALFAAVELGELLSQYAASCDCGATYGDALGADDPLIWWRMDEVAGTFGADSGSLGLPFHINPDSLAFGGPGLWDYGHSLVASGTAYNGGEAAFNPAVNFPGKDGFTITALIKWQGAGLTGAIVSHGETNTDWANWALFVDASGHAACWLSSANNSAARIQFTSTATLTAGVVYRLVMRWIVSTGEVGIWINGDRVVTATWAHTLWNSLAPVGIGCVPHAGGSDPQNAPFIGLMDEIAIYDKPLSDDRIAAHWAAFTGVPTTVSHVSREDTGYSLREDGGYVVRE